MHISTENKAKYIYNVQLIEIDVTTQKKPYTCIKFLKFWLDWLSKKNTILLVCDMTMICPDTIMSSLQDTIIVQLYNTI